MHKKIIITGLLLIGLFVASCTNGQQTTTASTSATPTSAAAESIWLRSRRLAATRLRARLGSRGRVA